MASSRGQDTLAQEVEAGAAKHRALEHLDPVDVALDDSGVPGQRQACDDRVALSVDIGRGGAAPRRTTCYCCAMVLRQAALRRCISRAADGVGVVDVEEVLRGVEEVLRGVEEDTGWHPAHECREPGQGGQPRPCGPSLVQQMRVRPLVPELCEAVAPRAVLRHLRTVVRDVPEPFRIGVGDGGDDEGGDGVGPRSSRGRR